MSIDKGPQQENEFLLELYKSINKMVEAALADEYLFFKHFPSYQEEIQKLVEKSGISQEDLRKKIKGTLLFRFSIGLQDSSQTSDFLHNTLTIAEAFGFLQDEDEDMEDIRNYVEMWIGPDVSLAKRFGIDGIIE